MNNQPKGNLILFPRTIEYYQVQLTRMLETERYREAIRLLEFLLECKEDDPRVRKEWEALLDWLQSQFVQEGDREEAARPEDEAEFLENLVHTRLKKNNQYRDELLNMLFHSSSLEKQLLSLEQLAYVKDSELADRLQAWLEETPRHPMLQFKTLQVLKQLGATGKVHMERNREKLELAIEETPLTFNDFPAHVIQVLHLVQKESEVSLPNLTYFAEQTWKEFLSYIYGTESYRLLVGQAQDHLHVCAAALHYISVEVMTGEADLRQVLHLYGVEEEEIFMWEKMLHMLRHFVHDAFSNKNEK